MTQSMKRKPTVLINYNPWQICHKYALKLVQVCNCKIDVDPKTFVVVTYLVPVDP
jgi:flagellar assembly factor FliW